MEIVYMIWAVLGACFAVMLFVMHSREVKAAHSQDSAIDPMFRRSYPSFRSPKNSSNINNGLTSR